MLSGVEFVPQVGLLHRRERRSYGLGFPCCVRPAAAVRPQKNRAEGTVFLGERRRNIEGQTSILFKRTRQYLTFVSLSLERLGKFPYLKVWNQGFHFFNAFRSTETFNFFALEVMELDAIHIVFESLHKVLFQ